MNAWYECLEVPNMPGLTVDTEGRLYRDGEEVGYESEGYVYIHPDKRKSPIKRAVLVATAFHGPRPPDKYGVCHANDIKTDDRPANLYWGTRFDNARDAVRNGRLKPPPPQIGEDSTVSKLSDDDVRAIRRLFSEGGVTKAELGRRFGVTDCNIGLIIRRVTWRHVSDQEVCHGEEERR